MQVNTYPLSQQTIGTRRELVSLHYGNKSRDLKIYLQASLHADEVPPMLVQHHLRSLLDQAEKEGLIEGEIVLVPYANAIGLSQHVMHDHLGRFDLNTGLNFNRSHPDFYQLIAENIESQLSQDIEANKRAIRKSIAEALEQRPQLSELDEQRAILLKLSHDADYVLDMHCDFEALMHLYTDTPYLEQAEHLSRYLGVETLLHAEGSGGSAFDEAQAGVWYRLQERFGARYPIPLAGCGVTIEYRGEADVSHTYAEQDAQNLFAWLCAIGVIDQSAPSEPTAKFESTPLAGCDSIDAQTSGIIVFLKELGDWVEAGEAIAEIISPLDQSTTPACATVSGKFFARTNQRFAARGTHIGKIAGAKAFKEGVLLGA